MEMHGFDNPKIVEVLRKLKQNFYLVNLHFNNWSCTPKAAPLPAWAYQTHWVNKRIGVPDSAVPVPAPMSRSTHPTHRRGPTVSCARRGRSPDSSRPGEYSCCWPNESPRGH